MKPSQARANNRLQPRNSPNIFVMGHSYYFYARKAQHYQHTFSAVLPPKCSCHLLCCPQKEGQSFSASRVGQIPDVSGTVRPRVTRPQAAQTLTMHVFEQGQKNLRCTNLRSENLKLHSFLMFLPLSNSSFMNFELHKFFHSKKMCISKPYHDSRWFS